MPSSHIPGGCLVLYTVANELLSDAVAPRTKSVYETGYNTYVRFLLMYGIVSSIPHKQAPPVDENLLVLFVAYCVSVLTLSHGTIKSYLCGVRYMCLVLGPFNSSLLLDEHNYPRLAAVLKGVKRTRSVCPLIRLPITYDVLTNICCRLREGVFTPYFDILMETACTIAFFGFLRCGEFTVHGPFDPAVNLCIGDMQILEDSLILTLKTPKTDPFRRGIAISLYKICANICPYVTMGRFLAYR